MSEAATKIRVIHWQTDEGWESEAPELKEWKRQGETLEQMRQLAEDGVRWALNSDQVEVEHLVMERPEEPELPTKVDEPERFAKSQQTSDEALDREDRAPAFDRAE